METGNFYKDYRNRKKPNVKLWKLENSKGKKP